jgi:hypothetical protein
MIKNLLAKFNYIGRRIVRTDHTVITQLYEIFIPQFVCYTCTRFDQLIIR